MSCQFCGCSEGAADTVKAAHTFLAKVAWLLAEKNASYGDAIANPCQIFSRSSPEEQLKVRIDDKLGRFKNGNPDYANEDTLLDLIGYCARLAALRATKKESNDE